jgi:hypothetical protein
LRRIDEYVAAGKDAFLASHLVQDAVDEIAATGARLASPVA